MARAIARSGVDADTHEIVAVELTPNGVGDSVALPALLDQLDADVASVTADGAYDGQVVYDAVAEQHPKALVIVPPRVTAVADGTVSLQRDKHVTTIAEHGRMSWQRSSGYNHRSLVETAMFRYKTVIGRRRTEAKVGCNVLNRMTGIGMPVFARIPLHAVREGATATASLFADQRGWIWSRWRSAPASSLVRSPRR